MIPSLALSLTDVPILVINEEKPTKEIYILNSRNLFIAQSPKLISLREDNSYINKSAGMVCY